MSLAYTTNLSNHFIQSYTLQIQWILEAVFARLGVKHEARNFGNGGMGKLFCIVHRSTEKLWVDMLTLRVLILHKKEHCKMDWRQVVYMDLVSDPLSA